MKNNIEDVRITNKAGLEVAFDKSHYKHRRDLNKHDLLVNVLDLLGDGVHRISLDKRKKA